MRRSTILLLTAALGVATTACSGDADYKADATVTACTAAADGGKPVAEGQVTNSSSKTSNYTVRVAFYDTSDNKVTDGIDAVTSVEAGSASPWRVTGLGSMNGPVDCRISGVSRNAAPGA